VFVLSFSKGTKREEVDTRRGNWKIWFKSSITATSTRITACNQKTNSSDSCFLKFHIYSACIIKRNSISRKIIKKKIEHFIHVYIKTICLNGFSSEAKAEDPSGARNRVGKKTK
jgi:hypothetical protein